MWLDHKCLRLGLMEIRQLSICLKGWKGWDEPCFAHPSSPLCLVFPVFCVRDELVGRRVRNLEPGSTHVVWFGKFKTKYLVDLSPIK